MDGLEPTPLPPDAPAAPREDENAVVTAALLDYACECVREARDLERRALTLRQAAQDTLDAAIHCGGLQLRLPDPYDHHAVNHGTPIRDAVALNRRGSALRQEAASVLRRLERIGGCCETHGVFVAPSGDVASRPLLCRDRACARCGRLKAWRVTERTREAAFAMLKRGYTLRVLTLTMRGNPWHSLRERCQLFRGLFKQLRSFECWHGVAGALLFLETPRNRILWNECVCRESYGVGRKTCPYCEAPAGRARRVYRAAHWHTHAHILVWFEDEGDAWPDTTDKGEIGRRGPDGNVKAVLRHGRAQHLDVVKVWSALCGVPLGECRASVDVPFVSESRQVHPRDTGLQAIDAAVKYAAKYCAKGQGAWTDPRDVVDWYKEASHLRFFDAYGADFRALWSSTKPGSTSVFCGLEDELEIRALRQIERAAGGDPREDHCSPLLRTVEARARQKMEDEYGELFRLKRLARVGPIPFRVVRAAERRAELADRVWRDVAADVWECDDDRASYLALSCIASKRADPSLYGWAHERRPQSWDELRKQRLWKHGGALYKGGSVRDVWAKLRELEGSPVFAGALH